MTVFTGIELQDFGNSIRKQRCAFLQDLGSTFSETPVLFYGSMHFYRLIFPRTLKLDFPESDPFMSSLHQLFWKRN